MHFKDSGNNEVMPFAVTEKDLETVIFMKSDTEGEISYGTPCVWYLKINDRNELIYKLETDSQTLRMNLWWPGCKNGRNTHQIKQKRRRQGIYLKKNFE